MTSPNGLREVLRAARHADGLSQLELGKKLGLNERAVKRWEREGGPEVLPTAANQAALVKALPSLDADELSAVVGSLRQRDAASRRALEERLDRVEAVLADLEAVVAGLAGEQG